MAVIHSELKGDVKFTNHRIDGDVENTNHTIRGNVQQSLGLMSEWGKIVGDIDDQTDLKNALDGKADASDIPVVNNATLHIQKNGLDVATFTANDNTETYANLVIPDNVLPVRIIMTDETHGTSDVSAYDIFSASGTKTVYAYAFIDRYYVATLSSTGFEADGNYYYAVLTYEDQTNSTYKYLTMTIIGNAVTLSAKDGYITGIDSTMVTDALGFTPYSDANPSNYTSDEALTTTDIDEAIA